MDDNYLTFTKRKPDSKQFCGPWGAVVKGEPVYVHTEKGKTYKFNSLQLLEILRPLDKHENTSIKIPLSFLQNFILK